MLIMFIFIRMDIKTARHLTQYDDEPFYCLLKKSIYCDRVDNFVTKTGNRGKRCSGKNTLLF